MKTRHYLFIFLISISLLPQPVDAADKEIHVGTGMTGHRGGTGVTLNGNFLFAPQASNARYGIETGVWALRFDPMILILPVLATAYYQFPVDSKAHPYLGASVGIMVNLKDNPTGTGVGLFLRPGINIPLSEELDLVAEVKVGGIDGAFLVIGQASFKILL